MVNFDNFHADITDDNVGFFACASRKSVTATAVLNQLRPGWGSFRCHSLLQRMLPHASCKNQIAQGSINFAMSFLSFDHQCMMRQAISWCQLDSTQFIQMQFDQTVVIICGKGVGVPFHTHSNSLGNMAISYCVKLTAGTPSSLIFEVNDVEYAVFDTVTDRITRFLLPSNDFRHGVKIDKLDNNLYMWVVIDGVDLVDKSLHGAVTVERFRR